jgi:hypothetical protein
LEILIDCRKKDIFRMMDSSKKMIAKLFKTKYLTITFKKVLGVMALDQPLGKKKLI